MADQRSPTSKRVPISRNLTSIARSALNTRPRAPGATWICAARALSIIGCGMGLLIENSPGPGSGRAAALGGNQADGPGLGDRKMLKSRTGPSLVLMVVSRRAQVTMSAPWYGLSVTMPSVMLRTIGGNDWGKALVQS